MVKLYGNLRIIVGRPNGRPYRCPKCGMEFKSPYDWRAHKIECFNGGK